MPKGACCTQKAVLVTVFVERPRRRVPIRREAQIRHPITQSLLPRRSASRRGYDRRAELLRYSQGLRESARSKLNHPAPVAAHKYHPSPKIVAVQIQHKQSRFPSCLGSLFRSSKVSHRNKEKKKKHGNSSATIQMDNIMKSFKAKKKWGFLSKFMATFQKR